MTATVTATADGLRIDGDVNYENVDELRVAGVALLAQRQEPACVVDLGGVTEPGTVVVALLLAFYRDVRKRSATLTLANIPAALQRILEFTGVMNVLEGPDAVH